MGASDSVENGTSGAALAADHVTANASEHGMLVEELTAARAVAALQREGIPLRSGGLGEARTPGFQQGGQRRGPAGFGRVEEFRLQRSVDRVGVHRAQPLGKQRIGVRGAEGSKRGDGALPFNRGAGAEGVDEEWKGLVRRQMAEVSLGGCPHLG